MEAISTGFATSKYAGSGSFVASLRINLPNIFTSPKKTIFIIWIFWAKTKSNGDTCKVCRSTLNTGSYGARSPRQFDEPKK